MNSFYIYLIVSGLAVVVSGILGYLIKIEKWDAFKFVTRRARFFDQRGDYVGSCRIDPYKRVFSFKGGSYNYLPDHSSRMRTFFFGLLRVDNYFYSIGDPMALLISRVTQPIISSETYRNILETDFVKKLSQLTRNGLAELLTPKNIILALIIGGLLYYFSTGRDITGRSTEDAQIVARNVTTILANGK